MRWRPCSRPAGMTPSFSKDWKNRKKTLFWKTTTENPSTNTLSEAPHLSTNWGNFDWSTWPPLVEIAPKQTSLQKKLLRREGRMKRNWDSWRPLSSITLAAISFFVVVSHSLSTCIPPAQDQFDSLQVSSSSNCSTEFPTNSYPGDLQCNFTSLGYVFPILRNALFTEI